MSKEWHLINPELAFATQPRWGWSRPNKIGFPEAQQFIKHTQLRERPNRPKRLVQWGKGGSPF
jgi:hypothetical protein